MVTISAGQPRLMQEIGNGIFWALEGNRVDLNAFRRGFSLATNELGRKYFGPWHKIITTDEYRSILNTIVKVSEQKPGLYKAFNKFEILSKLKSADKNKLDNFLQKMKRLGAMLPGEERGEWSFPDILTFSYFQFESRLLVRRNSFDFK